MAEQGANAVAGTAHTPKIVPAQMLKHRLGHLRQHWLGPVVIEINRNIRAHENSGAALAARR